MERGQPSNPDLFLHIPFAKRWDYHKNTIYRLYIEEECAVEEVADIMKRDYRFDASVRQYKHRFKKWDMFKSISSAVKDKAIQTLGKRVRDGTEFGGIRYRGVEIDAKRLRRYINDEMRLNPDLELAPSVFARWNLPYPALKATLAPHITPATPGNSDFSTPSDYSVLSPPAIRDRPTPTNAASPTDAPNATVRAIQVRTHHDRAKFFVQGDIEQFLKGMPTPEKRVATTWLHQFWIFAFTTLKYWGRGPKEWTADMLRMAEFPELNSFPGSPAFWRESQAPSPSGNAQNQHGVRLIGQQHELAQPSSLCRWCIHVRNIQYERIRSPPPEEEVNYDAQDTNNWPTWANRPSTVVERLQEALEENSFSNINAQDLPLSTSVIATAAASSPNAISVEAIAFAIMARNVDLIESMVQEANEKEDLDLSNIYPYHLAASYIDGSGACCDIFFALMDLVKQNVVKKLYVNDLGHTALDSLMLTILKGHTSCTPTMVDERLKTMTRFPGEDIDICGRWDADSPCLRALNASGSPRIPFSWKHMFCHTSIQAICHAIIRLFSPDHSPDINTSSGLFTKSCFTCGDRLVPGPLHTLVLTAFNLAQHGCHGENLFGIVACLVCMLVYGADPTAQANLSVNQLLGIDEQQQCTHAPLDALELAAKVPPAAWDSWSEEAKLGWDCLMAVLGFAQRQRAGRSREPASRHEHHDIEFPSSTNRSFLDDDYERCAHGRHYASSRHLGVLWCAIQTELVTYRRLRDGDPWLSENFSLAAVRDGANGDAGFSRLPLVDKKMMKRVCKCGRLESQHGDIATTDDACSFYFSNMEDWERSTYRLI
ncbi:hypothetical protein F4860DRAFT_164385 [Xylaria cubensis]|nr:hypothetical protein F4860DRAFT_164385 [Xylaria cubensis]